MKEGTDCHLVEEEDLHQGFQVSQGSSPEMITYARLDNFIQDSQEQILALAFRQKSFKSIVPFSLGICSIFARSGIRQSARKSVRRLLRGIWSAWGAVSRVQWLDAGLVRMVLEQV